MIIMKIKKGQLLLVEHIRKGNFKAIAKTDFDTNEEVFFPVCLAKNNHVGGTTTDWIEGEDIPCKSSLCKIKIINN